MAQGWVVVMGTLFCDAASCWNSLSALTSETPAANATEESKLQELKSELGWWLSLGLTEGLTDFYLLMCFALLHHGVQSSTL
jgi:hypothetical protein